MATIIGILVLLVLLPLTLLVLYQWFLAVSSFFYRPSACQSGSSQARFLILIPAHNEEVGIASTLESLRTLNYPDSHYQILVVADRCSDETAAVAKRWRAECFERSDGQPGKGAALAWGIQQARSARIAFDAVVIVDADTLADRDLLVAFNAELQAGRQVQQGYNYISNPWASPFTRIIAVTGVLRNGRYYAGKTVLGLQGMLTGTGMCLSAGVLERRGWTAFSVGEDWEFSVELLLGGDKIYFNPMARTFAKESQSFKQASHQRLRWASGRYAVMGGKIWSLITQGIAAKSFSLLDSAVTLVAPNYSSQASLALLCLVASVATVGDPVWGFSFYWAAGLLAAITGYFLLGVFSTESPGKALAGLALVPVFLPWRLAIEVLGMLGYGRRSWGRSARAADSSQRVNR
ncbi:MAG: Putative Cell wall biosynthesis glycosyltransferase-like protein [Nitrospira sp.]|nr:MAG: Putative Cell wall biosynthesis glycosyltransferase-like protein [Nitrospira sp.]